MEKSFFHESQTANTWLGEWSGWTYWELVVFGKKAELEGHETMSDFSRAFSKTKISFSNHYCGNTIF